MGEHACVSKRCVSTDERHAEPQNALTLRQAEPRTAAPEIARKMQISEAKPHRWKQRLDGLGTAETHLLKQLEEENRKFKKPVADLPAPPDWR